MPLLAFSRFMDFDLPPAVLFEKFGTGDESLGWLFGADVVSLKRGAPVRMMVPLGCLGTTEGVARIHRVVPYRRIDIVHESPWSGRVSCRFKRSGAGSRIRLVVEVDSGDVGWLSERLGLSVPGPLSGDEVRIGLLVSLSGPAGIFGRATVNCGEMAAAEVNDNGGVGGRRVRIVTADDGTDINTAVLAMHRLLRAQRVHVVVGMHSSATYRAVREMPVRDGVPYLYTPTSEEMGAHPLLLQLGETPIDQLHRALPRLAAETGGYRWYVVGNDYSWPRAIGSTAQDIIRNMRGTVLGESYLPLGNRNFGALIEDISTAGAELVVSSFVGQDQVRFEKQFAAAGLRSVTRTFAPLMDETTLEHMGSAAEGIWNVRGYFKNLPSAENRQFLDRYLSTFGDCAPPVSGLSESVYTAVRLWCEAAREARTTQGLSVMRKLRGRRFDSPRGRLEVSSRGQVSQPLYLAEATSSSLSVLDSLDGVRRQTA